MQSSNRNNMGTPVPPGIVTRLTQAARYVVAGVTPESWFGPLQPLTPIAQEKTEGRQYDYETGFNLRQNPKQAEGTTHASLRALADGYDLLRIVIETRKDQISALTYSFKKKDAKDDGEGDPRIAQLTEFFAMPDKEHTWDVWLRALIEDLLVIDAPTIYPAKTVGGKLYALELMDGATIKRVIDDKGRTPLPPSPAYQQVLKGLPASDYTRDTLIYAPRNIRTNRVYGFSPVEQVQMTVNIALRRQLSQLQYYTDGSTPDLIFGVPDTWQPDQIRQFQEWWDSILTGNTAARRGTRFVPGGLAPYNTKDQVLKDSYDEWLARIICFAFSISPQALSQMMNRATAETAGEQAAEEGLYPLMQWVKNVVDRVVVQFFGWPDIEFKWNSDESVDALTQMQIDTGYITAKVKDVNEVRDKLGLPALTPEQEEKMNPRAPVPPDGGGGPPVQGGKPEPDPEAAKLEGVYLKKARAIPIAKAKAVPALNRDRRSVKVAHKSLVAAIERWQAVAKADMTRQALALFESRKGAFIEALPMHKADAVSADDARLKVLRQKALDELRMQLETIAGINVLYGEVENVLAALAVDGAVEALVQIGMNDVPAVTLDLVNEQAVAWAKTRAAEMVGMKMVDGELVPNPNAYWVITDKQREETASLVVAAMEGGWSNDRLSKELSEAAAFDPDRAIMIARTETAIADVQGNMVAYRNSSVVTGKSWILGEEACPICVENAAVGSIGLADLFPSGDDGPPAHPNCFTGDAVVTASGVSAYFKRWFEGEVIIVSTTGHDDLTVTPNHPILTARGWVAAGMLELDDELFECRDPGAGLVSAGHPNDNHVHARFDEVFRAALMAVGMTARTVEISPEHFHGDGVIDTQVNVVRATGPLTGDFAKGNEGESNCTFCGREIGGAEHALASDGRLGERVIRSATSTHSGVSGIGESLSFARGGDGHAQVHCSGFAANFKPHALPSFTKGAAVAADAPGNIHARLTGHITSVKIESLDRRKYAGHVYNLETKDGWYFANGIIAHNCRCDILPTVIEDGPTNGSDNATD